MKRVKYVYSSFWEQLNSGSNDSHEFLHVIGTELDNLSNVRLFRNVSIIFDKIKEEARIWVIIGAKNLGALYRKHRVFYTFSWFSWTQNLINQNS
jgi:hypothetical protein